MSITIGMQYIVETVVNKDNIASAVGSGLVDVFATPMLIAQMELAASKCIAGELEEGQASVGTSINVSHSAASPIGARITTTAVVTAVDRRKVDFSVSSSDNGGEIGIGTHTRFIIDTERFMVKATDRKQAWMKFTYQDNRVYYQNEAGDVLAEALFPAIDSETVDINRTFVDDSLRGQGVADKLLHEVYKIIKSQNKRAVASCPYAVKWFEKNIEKQDILK